MSQTELSDKSKIKPGIYQHYKGQKYLVLGTACHSETEQQHVVYQTLYGDFSFWVRPLDMFTEYVTFDGEQLPRFKYVSPA